jgi:hypothetical protein
MRAICYIDITTTDSPARDIGHVHVTGFGRVEGEWNQHPHRGMIAPGTTGARPKLRRNHRVRKRNYRPANTMALSAALLDNRPLKDGRAATAPEEIGIGLHHLGARRAVQLRLEGSPVRDDCADLRRGDRRDGILAMDSPVAIGVILRDAQNGGGQWVRPAELFFQTGADRGQQRVERVFAATVEFHVDFERLADFLRRVL